MLELADYKVRILEGSHGTGAVTRVLIESSDGTGAARYLEHGGGGREHHRRVVARPGGSGNVRAAAGGPRAPTRRRMIFPVTRPPAGGSPGLLPNSFRNRTVAPC